MTRSFFHFIPSYATLNEKICQEILCLYIHNFYIAVWNNFKLGTHVAHHIENSDQLTKVYILVAMVTITMVTVPKIIKMCIHNFYNSLCLCNNLKLGTHVINDLENLNTHKTISMWVLCLPSLWLRGHKG